MHAESAALCDGLDRPGVVSFVPAGQPRQAYYEDADLVYAALWFDPRLPCLDGVLKGPPPTTINARDGVLAALLDDLQRQLAESVMPDACYIEHLLSLAFCRAATMGRARQPAAPAGKLSAATLRRIEDYIDAHLRAEIGVSALAGIAGIGPDSFARRFKATIGISPYAFVLERRMRRAEHALAHSRLPIANLAAQLGFTSQSHFTATFRRRCGATPQAYRAAFFQNHDSAPEIVTEIR